MAINRDPDPVIYEQQVRIEASPESVFELLVDADSIRRWLGVAARADPRPGGELRITFESQDTVSGEYLIVDRPHRVVFTWGYEGSVEMPPGSSTVHITLKPDGDGTLLELVHRDCPPQRLDDHAKGWDFCLDRLGRIASDAQPHLSTTPNKEKP